MASFNDVTVEVKKVRGMNRMIIHYVKPMANKGFQLLRRGQEFRV